LQPTNDDDEVFLLQLEKNASLKDLYVLTHVVVAFSHAVIVQIRQWHHGLKGCIRGLMRDYNYKFPHRNCERGAASASSVLSSTSTFSIIVAAFKQQLPQPLSAHRRCCLSPPK
jgi:hypothetical protein